MLLVQGVPTPAHEKWKRDRFALCVNNISEDKAMTLSLGRLASIGLFLALVQTCWAGGSGLNVIVVVNQNSTNSVQLGNYYCEQRNVPPQNLLRISWAGGNVEWTNTDYNTYLLNPLQVMLSTRQ